MTKHKLDRRVQISKCFLKEALISLLQKKRISQITVIELCKLADVNRSTFYAHYADLYGLLLEMENEIIEQLKKALLAYIKNDESPLVMTEKLIKFIGRKQTMCEVLLSPYSNSSFEKKISEIVHEFLLSEWEGITKTEERLFTYRNAFIVSGSIEVVKTWLKNGKDRSPKEIAQLINDLAKHEGND